MIFLLPWHYTQQSFCHRHSDHLHCTNRPLTYVLRKDMSTITRRSKVTPLIKNVLNEISRKSYLNHTTWLKFCDGSFTIVTPNNFPWCSGQQRFVWSKTDTFTIMTSISQLINSVFDCRFYSNKHTYMFLFVTHAFWVFIVRICFFVVQCGFIWNHWMGALHVTVGHRYLDRYCSDTVTLLIAVLPQVWKTHC